MSPEEANALVGETLAGYRITALLESTGSAALYQATNSADGQHVILKVLDPAAAREPGTVERFRADAARIASLRHPSLASVSRVGEDRGYHYAVQPLFLGSLRDQLTREGTPTPAEAVAIGARLAEVLATLHRQDIVYGDVRPEHVLLTHNGSPILSVFRVRHLRNAESGEPERDMTYAPPEQRRGEEPDVRSDIYALGAILYELLTGTPPRSPAEDAATDSKRGASAIPPSQINPRVPPTLDAVVLRALAPQPADRFQDVKSFATALEGISDVGNVDELATVKVPAAVPLPAAPDILAAETVKTVALPNWPMRIARPEPDERRPRRVLVLALLGVLLLSLSSGLFFVLHSGASGTTGSLSSSPTSDFNTPTLPYTSDTPFGTATDPSSTATNGAPTNTPHAGPTDTPIPGATATHTPKPTATAKRTPIPTATATATNVPPTATPTPAYVDVSPLPINAGTCGSSVAVLVSNIGQIGMTWSINDGGYTTEDVSSDSLSGNSNETINVTVLSSGTIYFNGASNSPFAVDVNCS